jgi:hypothetical protein
MPDLDLRELYLQRLGDSLAVSDHEREAAIEEIDSHLQLAADEMVARGTPRDAAVRQVLERLGTPERLARDITSAHRRPLDLVTAVGVAMRVSVASGFKAIVLAWVGIALLAILLGLAVAGIRNLVGSQFLQADWSPVLDGLVPAAVGAVVAYAVGRSLVAPIAIAARRSRSEVRWPVLVVGVVVAAAIGLTGVEARWSLGTAIAMASLPAWFALGILRPDLVPARRLPGRWFAVAIVVLVVALPALLLAAGGRLESVGSSVVSEAFDPNVAYAVVGRFVDLEHPPIQLADATTSADAWIGPGPITVSRSGTFVNGSASDWTDLRLEVWQGPADELDGEALDPAATAPLVTAPMATDGRRVSGEVELWPSSDSSFYYVAVTGLAAAGERVQLAWPGVEHWQWRGTTLQFFGAIGR